MGKKYTTRHKARRKLDGCAVLCDNINAHLAEISQWYEPTHEEIFLILLEIGRIIEAGRKLLLDLRKEL